MFDCLLELEYFNAALGKKAEDRTDTHTDVLIRPYVTLASRNLKPKPSIPTAPFPLSVTHTSTSQAAHSWLTIFFDWQHRIFI